MMSDFAVIDAFLSEVEREQIRMLLADEGFTSSQLRIKRTAFREWDGDASVGVSIGTEGFAARNSLQFPTGTAYDIFGSRIKEYLQTGVPSVDSLGLRGLKEFSFRAYKYGPGTGLTWHTDGPFPGAFAYYAHDKWMPHWGGVLLVGKRARAVDSASVHRSFYRYAVPETFEQGDFVLPAPNRLVILRGGAPHSITPVTAAAGDRFRLSLSGFFR